MHSRGAISKLTMALLMALMLSIAACGGPGIDGDGWCRSDGPTISNLSLLPNLAVLGEGGGSIDVDVTFDYRTRNGAKLGFFYYSLIDASGTRTIEEVINVLDLNLKGSGTYTLSISLPTQTAQIYRFQVRLADQCKTRSNWAEVNFSVTEPAGLGGKTDFGVARLNGVLYVIGGRDASGSASNTLLRFDPVTGVTTTHASMPEGRFSAAIATYDKLIFVFGGNAFGYMQNSTFVYNSATDSWTARAPMARPMAGAHAFVIDGMTYIAKDGRVDQYDPVVDIWK